MAVVLQTKFGVAVIYLKVPVLNLVDLYRYSCTGTGASTDSSRYPGTLSNCLYILQSNFARNSVVQL